MTEKPQLCKGPWPEQLEQLLCEYSIAEEEKGMLLKIHCPTCSLQISNEWEKGTCLFNKDENNAKSSLWAWTSQRLLSDNGRVIQSHKTVNCHALHKHLGNTKDVVYRYENDYPQYNSIRNSSEPLHFMWQAFFLLQCAYLVAL